MGKIVTHGNLGVDLCKVFGLDPDKVTSISIKSVPGNIVKVAVDMTCQEGDEVYKVMHDYEYHAQLSNLPEGEPCKVVLDP